MKKNISSIGFFKSGLAVAIFLSGLFFGDEVQARSYVLKNTDQPCLSINSDAHCLDYPSTLKTCPELGSGYGTFCENNGSGAPFCFNAQTGDRSDFMTCPVIACPASALPCPNPLCSIGRVPKCIQGEENLVKCVATSAGKRGQTSAFCPLTSKFAPGGENACGGNMLTCAAGKRLVWYAQPFYRSAMTACFDPNLDLGLVESGNLGDNFPICPASSCSVPCPQNQTWSCSSGSVLQCDGPDAQTQRPPRCMYTVKTGPYEIGSTVLAQCSTTSMPSAPVPAPVSYTVASVAGCPTQQQFNTAFAELSGLAMGTFSQNIKTSKKNPLMESDLHAYRKDKLGITYDTLFNTLKCCRQQITQSDSSKDGVKLLCGKLEIKQGANGIYNAQARGDEYPFFASPTSTSRRLSTSRNISFALPRAGGISSTNAIDKTKLSDFFDRNAGIPATGWPLGQRNDIDQGTRNSHPQERFRLLPENLMHYAFFPHRGLRRDLFAYFLAPFASDDRFVEWEKWGEYFAFVIDKMGDMTTVMGDALVNLVIRGNPEEIINLHGDIFTRLSGQVDEIFNDRFSPKGGDINWKNSVNQKAKSIWDSSKIGAKNWAVSKGWATQAEKDANSAKWRAAQLLGVTAPTNP